jgi:hypothetical protein
MSSPPFPPYGIIVAEPKYGWFFPSPPLHSFHKLVKLTVKRREGKKLGDLFLGLLGGAKSWVWSV